MISQNTVIDAVRFLETWRRKNGVPEKEMEALLQELSRIPGNKSYRDSTKAIFDEFRNLRSTLMLMLCLLLVPGASAEEPLKAKYKAIMAEYTAQLSKVAEQHNDKATREIIQERVDKLMLGWFVSSEKMPDLKPRAVAATFDCVHRDWKGPVVLFPDGHFTGGPLKGDGFWRWDKEKRKLLLNWVHWKTVEEYTFQADETLKSENAVLTLKEAK